MLDASWDIYPEWAKDIFPMIRSGGGQIITCVYDILPVTHPHFFPIATIKMFAPWLESAAQNSDKIVTISEATKSEINRLGIAPKVRKDTFHLGANFVKPTEKTVRSASALPSFLMVGTIEPRKGHAVVLAAFQDLWNKGCQVRLTFIGRTGWKVEETLAAIGAEAARNPLFEYLPSAPDGVLSERYSSADAIIAASIIEGFGLPLAGTRSQPCRVG